MNKKAHILSRLASLAVVVLAVCETGVIVVSWLLSAVSPNLGVRSLLSSEGIRYLVGSLVSDVAAAPFVWIVLLGMSLGLLRASGLTEALRCLAARARGSRMTDGSEPDPLSYGLRIALYATLFAVMAFIAVVCFLTFAPGAVLLSATGSFSGSSILMGMIPLVAACIALAATTYGACASRFADAASYFAAMTSGAALSAPFLVLYIFIAQLAFSVLYAFGWLSAS